jgi:hypothetical protein
VAQVQHIQVAVAVEPQLVVQVELQERVAAWDLAQDFMVIQEQQIQVVVVVAVVIVQQGLQ